LRTWLKELRERKEMTQSQVAESCKISRSYYTHIEKGTKTPSVENAKKIASVLDFSWTNFFED
jgi:putative transcriptional regulator